MGALRLLSRASLCGDCYVHGSKSRRGWACGFTAPQERRRFVRVFGPIAVAACVSALIVFALTPLLIAGCTKTLHEGGGLLALS